MQTTILLLTYYIIKEGITEEIFTPTISKLSISDLSQPLSCYVAKFVNDLLKLL